MTTLALRYSGFVLIAGALLLALALILISSQPVASQILGAELSSVLLVAAILLLAALPGAHLKHADAAGKLGLAGYLTLQLGLLLLVIVAAPALTYPAVKVPLPESATALLLGIALFAGLLLTGIACLTGGVYPRWQGVLLLIASVGFLFSFFIAQLLPAAYGQMGTLLLGLLLGTAFSGMGIFIWDPAMLTMKYWSS